MAVVAIITAAGSGKRMKSGINKIFLSLNNVPVVGLTIEKFNRSDAIDTIIITAREEDIDELRALVRERGFDKVATIITGGALRQDSVYNGMKAIKHANPDDIVLIHNAVNPFVTENTIRKCIAAAHEHGASVAGIKAKDTIKEADTKEFVSRTLDRSRLWQVQTPQALRYSIALKAFEQAYADQFYGTDDVMLAERIGVHVKLVECEDENFKLTDPRDLAVARMMLEGIKTGFGMDSHRFEAHQSGKKCIMAGVEFPGCPGFEANSDGDVVLHALFNALSQALGKNSIGHYADDLCRNGIKDSSEYMKVVLSMMEEQEYTLSNIGIMIEGKEPRIAGREDAMKRRISNIMGIAAENIGITATSGEGLTDFGKGLGVQCFCVVSLHRRI